MVLIKEKCFYLMVAGMVNYILGLGVVLWKIRQAPLSADNGSEGCADCPQKVPVYRSDWSANIKGNSSSGALLNMGGTSAGSYCGPFRDRKDTLFGYWTWKKVSMCDGNMAAYKDLFANLRNVILNKHKSKQWSVPGIPLERVPNQKEENEFYSIKKGFFQIQCPKGLPMVFNETQVKRTWLQKTVLTESAIQLDNTTHRESKMTILVTRYGYANAYWAIVDLYNTFLLQNFFEKSCSGVKVLLLDSHPRGAFDSMWRLVFGKMLRLTDLQNVTLFRSMVWGMQSNQSPMLRQHMQHLPFVKQFRETVLSRHGVRLGHVPECGSGKLNIVFVWRHDYVAHPRNPSGRVTRKIANEEELLLHTRRVFRGANVRGVQLDNLPLGNQLQLISTTDILIGMHGAALAFTVFMTPGSGVIELYPKGQGVNWHFQNLAKWNGVHYSRWQSTDFRDGDPDFTYIPLSTADRLIGDMYKRVCNELPISARTTKMNSFRKH